MGMIKTYQEKLIIIKHEYRVVPLYPPIRGSSVLSLVEAVFTQPHVLTF